MHVSEGVMSAPVLAAGAALAIGGLALGLRRLDSAQLPKTALMAAVFFIGSLIHVPVGVVSVHLLLNGLVGLLLGWAAFPAIFTALALQAVLFQYGGLIVLGLNTATMALPAVVCHYAFGRMAASPRRGLAVCGGFATGFFAVFVSGMLTACALALSGDGLVSAGEALFASHLPVMLAEGVITALAVAFLGQVRPAMLRNGRYLEPEAEPGQARA